MSSSADQVLRSCDLLRLDELLRDRLSGIAGVEAHVERVESKKDHGYQAYGYTQASGDPLVCVNSLPLGGEGKSGGPWQVYLLVSGHEDLVTGALAEALAADEATRMEGPGCWYWATSIRCGTSTLTMIDRIFSAIREHLLENPDFEGKP